MLRKFLTIVSLVGLVLSLGLWAVSYRNIHWGIIPSWPSPDCEQTNNCTGVVGLSRGALVGWGSVDGDLEIDMQTYWSGFVGFQTLWAPHVGVNTRNQFKVWGFVVPLYIPLVASGFVFIWLIPGHRRRKRKKLGLCVGCGYDLRGSKERCSECGQVIE